MESQVGAFTTYQIYIYIFLTVDFMDFATSWHFLSKMESQVGGFYGFRKYDIMGPNAFLFFLSKMESQVGGSERISFFLIENDRKVKSVIS